MLSAEAVGLVVKAARGAIKLSRRIDLVRAEQQAVEAPLTLPLPELGLAPTQPQMRGALRELLRQTENEDPDPLGSDRADIEHAVDVEPENTVLFRFMKTYLPEQALGRVLDLDSTFMEELRAARPDWAADPDLTVAALYVGAGSDARSQSYTWRLALVVVDTLAEFGADHVALFTNDEGVQSVVAAVLQRFAEADVQTADSTGSLFRLVLSATVNGVLEAEAELDVDNPWLNAVLDALAKTRAALPEEQRDNFITGLLRGKGYQLLVSAIIGEISALLRDEDATKVENLATTLLDEIAGIIEREPNFEDFLQDHWGDLLRAAVSSVEKHGLALLKDDSPLLRDVLVAVANTIVRSPDNQLLSTDLLIAIVDTTVSVAAANPDQIDRIINSDWLNTLVRSISATVAGQGIRETLTESGVETLLKNTLRTFADHPELIVDEPGLAQELLEGILTSVSSDDNLSVEKLASAAVSSALKVVAEHPDVLKFRYAETVSSLAGRIAALVRSKQLTRVQGADILEAVTESLADNPRLFLDLENRLVGIVVDATTRAARASNGLLAGAALVKALKQIVEAIAATGNAAVRNHPAEVLAEQLEILLKAALVRAEQELGNKMGLRSLPPVLARLVRMWAAGEIQAIDPDSDEFRDLFADLVRQETANQLVTQ